MQLLEEIFIDIGDTGAIKNKKQHGTRSKHIWQKWMSDSCSTAKMVIESTRLNFFLSFAHPLLTVSNCIEIALVNEYNYESEQWRIDCERSVNMLSTRCEDGPQRQ